MSALSFLQDYGTAVGHVGSAVLFGPTERRLGRLATLGILAGVLPPVLTWGALGRMADTVLHPAWSQTDLNGPVFIVGNHRTGSTFLKRLLAADTDQFATTRFVDLFLHSVTQKRLLAALSAADERLGSPLSARIQQLDDLWAQDFRAVHSMGLTQPEEDDYLLLSRMASAILWEVVPDAPRLRRHFWSDTEMDPTEQDAHLLAYARLAQRHKYVHGGRVWLSKNPLFSTRVRGLRRTFPSARFIYLVRHSYKVVASTTSLLHEGLGGLGALRDDAHLQEMVHEICLYMHDRTLADLEDLPPSRLVCIRQEDLLAELVPTLQTAFAQLDLDWTPTLAAAASSSRERGPRKTHQYRMEDHGFTREDIDERYGHVMERWGYAAGG